MKKLALSLLVAATTSSVFGQGLINFFNTGTTLITTNSSVGGAASGSTGTVVPSYYYAIFVAPAGTSQPAAFTAPGSPTGTNQAAAGRFTGGASVAVAGWTAGATNSYLVRGWSSNLGANWQAANAAILNPAGFGITSYYFGSSAIGTGVAGGTDSGGNSIPPLNIFGTNPGQIAGFNLGLVQVTVVPEPGTVALAGLGLCGLLFLRRRK